MEDKTLLKIVKQEDMGLLFLSLEDGPYGWSLSKEMQKIMLDDLESHLRKFEFEEYEKSSQPTRRLIDDFIF